MSSYNFLKIISFLALVFVQSFASSDTNTHHLFVPEDVNAPSWIADRQQQQIATKKELKVFHNFSFTDTQPNSGIGFIHRIVDDAGKHYKAVHYDHGNGIAVADINDDDLLDVYLISQAGSNGLYQNLGGGKFKDITESSGTAVDDAIGVTASFVDIDNDGDADLYVTNVRSPNKLFLNNGDGTFQDFSKQSGLDYSEHSSAAVFFDYDKDGLLDLFLCVVGEYTTDELKPVTGTIESEKPSTISDYYVGHKDAFAGHLHKRRNRASRLFHNLGDNHFEDVTESLGIIDYGWTGAATPVDFNNDGWMDLYVLSMQGHDHYWVNQQGIKFIDKTDEYFTKTPWGAMGVKSFDYNNDGLMDLMISDMHSDMSEKIGLDKEKLKADWITENWSANFIRSNGKSIYGNALYKQAKGNLFSEISDQLNVENYWPWGLTVADINADGWQDMLLTSSMNYPFRYGPNSLLLNNQGQKFVDSEYILGIEPRLNDRTSKPWFQLDCDTQDKTHPICKQQTGAVTVNGALGTRSSAIFDIDNDGDLDMITNEFGDVPQVLVSNLSNNQKINYLKIKLIGSASNKQGLGARVKVISGDQQFTQVHDGQSGYLSQSSMPLYFGLGKQTKVDKIEVVWPIGKTQVIAENIQLNSLLTILESQGDE